MKRAQLLAAVLGFCAIEARAQEILDRMAEAMTISAFEDNLRLRLSGTVDLEYYHFRQLPPGLIDASGHNLFNPRLSLFLDAQLGEHVYAFAQGRADRGFDPRDEFLQMRLDEYALRITPWKEGQFSVQVGKYAAVIGNWIPRHLSWDNPFITAPLIYENVTILEDKFAVPPFYIAGGELLDEKYEYLPVIWGPSYATGLSVAGKLGMFEYAAEVKNAALSSRPESWSATEIGFEHPTVNARLGLRPNPMWNFGFSASKGAYFRPEAEPSLPFGTDIGDYDQLVLGQDVSFAWRHLQVWAEFYEARFELPMIGDADTFSYYVEAKYKFLPQLFGALRWNQQFFGDIPVGYYHREVAWWHDQSRIDVALIYRLTEHIQLKGQYNVQREEDRQNKYGHTFAAQLTVRF